MGFGAIRHNLTSGRSGAQAWAPDHPHVKIKNHGLGQYGAEPHYSTLPFWQLCALKKQEKYNPQEKETLAEQEELLEVFV